MSGPYPGLLTTNPSVASAMVPKPRRQIEAR
jgi:hypothetical protein